MVEIIKIYIVLISLTIIGSFGGYFLKKATDVEILYRTILKPWIYIGGALYVLSAVLNIYVLKYLPYTVVLPMTSLTYIWTMLISARFLDEKITKQKLIGIIFIIAGAIFIGITK